MKNKALISLSSTVAAIALLSSAHAGDLSSFEEVYIAPVEIASSLSDRPKRPSSRRSSRDERPVSDSDLSDKASDLHEDIVDILDDKFSVVDSAGAGVLTITPTLVELSANRPTIADLRANPSLSIKSRYSGGAEVSFSFSESGSDLGSYDKSWFDDIDQYSNTGAIWQDANRAFKVISRSLSKHIKAN